LGLRKEAQPELLYLAFPSGSFGCTSKRMVPPSGTVAKQHLQEHFQVEKSLWKRGKTSCLLGDFYGKEASHHCLHLEEA
jgi:hypothetical protein